MGVKLNPKFVKVENGLIYPTTSSGNLEVLDYKASNNVLVRFIDTGYECKTTTSHIYRGEVKDRLKKVVFGAGYIGKGRFKRHIHKKIYSVWYGMIRRCYSVEHKRLQPHYTNCYVAEEWHNFQKFAEWYSERNPNNSELFLDKDLLQFEVTDKVYSPATCLLVTRDVNNFIYSDKKKGKYGVGVAYDKRDNNGLKFSCFCGGRYCGKFFTKEEAQAAYVVAKKLQCEEIIVAIDDKRVAELLRKYTERFCDRLIDWK